MNDQELREAVLGRLKHAYYNAVTDDVALKNSVIPNKNHALEILEYKADEIMELFKQYQALREIDIRIDELQKLWQKFTDIRFDGTNGHNDNPKALKKISSIIAELQAQKDKLIKGNE